MARLQLDPLSDFFTLGCDPGIYSELLITLQKGRATLNLLPSFLESARARYGSYDLLVGISYTPHGLSAAACAYLIDSEIDVAEGRDLYY